MFKKKQKQYCNKFNNDFKNGGKKRKKWGKKEKNALKAVPLSLKVRKWQGWNNDPT